MSEETFTVALEGIGKARCRASERVIVALERARGFGQLPGLTKRLPVGCRRGGCGICRAEVLAGSWHGEPMSQAHVSLQEQQAGIILACSIYPRSDLTIRFLPRQTPADLTPA